MITTGPTFDYEGLVRKDRVHSTVFTSPEIFEEEMRKIFSRSWLYIAHDSEVPEPGDYVTKWIGRVSVILARDEDGEIRLFVNRCRHRGNAVCQYESGNSMFFTCPYHGFTYSSRGELVGVPRPDAYDETFRMEEFSLTPVPRTGTYRGFIFGNLSPEGISLDEHLGEPCKRMIDLFCDASPVGQIELRAGVHKHGYRGNWKQIGMDGYHAPVVHSSFFDTKRHRAEIAGRGRTAGDQRSRSYTRDLGHGHVMLDLRPGGGTLGAFSYAKDKPWFKGYLADLEKAYGKQRAQEIVASGADPHVHVYPNMQIIDVHIRVIYPLAVDETVIYMYPALLKGVPPELNELRLRVHEDFYGPASGGNPDDYEVFERVQLGMQGEVNPWIFLGRGLHREQREEEEAALLGTLVGDGGDETTQRGQLGRWKQEMMRP